MTITLDQVVLIPPPSAESWWALTGVSLLTAILLLVVFRFISNQSGIRQIKERIKAHVLELRLFKDEPRLILRAQKDIILSLGRYLRFMIIPVLVLVVPFLYLALHLELFFGYQPLRPGEASLVTVKLDDHLAWNQAQVDLHVPEGLRLETPPFRVQQTREIDWRLRAVREGAHDLTINVGEATFLKTVTVGGPLSRITPAREQASWLTVILPGETVLPRHGPVKAISVQYPTRDFRLFGWQMSWLVPFVVIVLVAGFALQRAFGVRL